MQILSLFLSIILVISLVFVISCVTKEVPVTETYYETEYRTENRTETYTTTEDVVVKTIEGSNTLSAKSQWRTNWVYIGDQNIGYFTDYYGYDISAQEHTFSSIQISLGVIPQLNKGQIEVIDLTDACFDKNIPNAGWLFGKESTQRTTVFIPTEGCQLLAPHSIGNGGDPKTWIMGFNALVNEPGRILGTFSIGLNKGNNIMFGIKGVKEFAILACVEPELRQPDVKLIWSDDIIEKQTVTKERQVSYQVPVQVEKQRTVLQTTKVPFWVAIFH